MLSATRRSVRAPSSTLISSQEPKFTTWRRSGCLIRCAPTTICTKSKYRSRISLLSQNLALFAKSKLNANRYLNICVQFNPHEQLAWDSEIRKEGARTGCCTTCKQGYLHELDRWKTATVSLPAVATVANVAAICRASGRRTKLRRLGKSATTSLEPNPWWRSRWRRICRHGGCRGSRRWRRWRMDGHYWKLVEWIRCWQFGFPRQGRNDASC